MTVELFIR